MQDEPEKWGQLVYDWDMLLIMNDEQLETIEQIKKFLEGSEGLEFRGLSIEEKYKWWGGPHCLDRVGAMLRLGSAIPNGYSTEDFTIPSLVASTDVEMNTAAGVL